MAGQSSQWGLALVYVSQGVQGEVSLTDESGPVRLTAPFELAQEGDGLKMGHQRFAVGRVPGAHRNAGGAVGAEDVD